MPEPLMDKLSRLVRDNAWAGGVGMALTGYGFEWAKAPAVFSIILIVVGWLFIVFAIWQSKFFDAKSKRLQVVGHVLISGCIAILFVVAWFVLRPEPEGPRLQGPEPAFLSRWFTNSIAYLRALPWRWIVPSVAIGILTTALIAWRLSFLRARKWQTRE